MLFIPLFAVEGETESQNKKYQFIKDIYNASGLYFIRLNAYDLDNTLRFNKLQKIMLVK